MHRELPPIEDVVEWFRRKGFKAKCGDIGDFKEKKCCLIPALVDIAGEKPNFDDPDSIYEQAFRIYGNKTTFIWRSFDRNITLPNFDYGNSCREALEAADLMVDDN